MKSIYTLGVLTSVCVGCSGVTSPQEREQAAFSAAYTLIEHFSSDAAFRSQLAIQREAAFRDGPEQVVAVTRTARDHFQIRYSEGIEKSFHVQYRELYRNIPPVEDETFSRLARYQQSTFSSTECPTIVAPLDNLSRSVVARSEAIARPIDTVPSADASEICISSDGPGYRLVMYMDDGTIDVQPRGCSALKHLMQTVIDQAKTCAARSKSP